MTRGTHSELPARLVRVRDKFLAWREGRVVGERIPDRLWNAAAKLAAVYGVNRTATVLSLDYYSLKRRLPDEADQASAATVTAAVDSVSGSFVELPSIPLAPANECVIELEDGTGASMRVHFKGADVADIVAVSGSLWNRG